jgi:alkanesulfonate monooxygenase SsuD/methylene tetrahydromethanopterin reductase-like flavin-dependent oxidoreductase (luciferase family)
LSPPPAVDLLLDPFGATWDQVSRAARVAEEAGYAGLWTWDHLAGQAHGTDRVLECWTTLTALAATVPRMTIGPLVLNVANRRPAVLATMAATLQEVSGGRLLLGLGAGGGRNVPYGAEQEATGVTVAPDAVRRAQVAEAIGVLRQLWTGRAVPNGSEQYPLGRAEGFIRPEPPPPVIVGAFGPKTARLAGEHADGINTLAGHARRDELIAVARAAHAEAGRDPDAFLVTLQATWSPEWLTAARGDELAAAGVHRIALLVHPPFDLDALKAGPTPRT